MSTQGPTPAARETVPTWKLVVFGVLAVYAVLIVLLNRDEIEVSFVFFETRISLLVLIILCVGIGFAAGYLFEQIRGRRRRSA
jgi:uncharacterized integral membrane protein